MMVHQPRKFRFHFAVRSKLAALAACLCLIAIIHVPAWSQTIPELVDPAAEATPETPAEKIETEESEYPSDEQLESRLKEILANLPGLSGVEVKASEGVIFLTGTVADTESRNTAQHLAERLSGAVTVINNIERDRTLGTRLQAAMSSLDSQFKELLGNAPLLILAIFVVAMAWFVSRLVSRAEWLFRRMSSNWFVQDMLRQLLQLAIVISGIIIALQLLDATAMLGSLLGAVGIIGLAVGFATRDTVENYIASLLLSLRQPFEADDYVGIEGIEGRVLRLTPRATILMSLDGNHQRIPNAKVYKATIINYTRNPLRRFEFDVGVDTEVDLSAARSLAVKTISGISGVKQDPPPLCLVHALGDSNVVLRVQGWINQKESDFQKVLSEARQQVKEAYDEAGIVMPEPIYNVNLRRTRKAQVTEQVPKPPVDAEYQEDTRPDDAITEQMRHERNQQTEPDLLDSNSKPE